jgi:predicted naringenin-chalcone synthase
MTRINAIGLAVPPNTFDQTQSALLMRRLMDPRGEHGGFIDAIHRRSGIERRSGVFLSASTGPDEPLAQGFYGAHAGAVESEGPGGGLDPQGPTTGERMRAYERLAGALAVEAGGRALRGAGRGGGREGGSITDLVVVSCTGASAPGVDLELIDRLGLSPSVRRTHVGFMGCHGAINGLRVGDAIVRSELAQDRAASVLVVCVELCTLHLQHDFRPDGVVANALFGDGAAGVVLSGETRGPGAGGPSAGGQGSVAAGWRVRARARRLLEGTREAMSWRVGDHGFVMSLAEDVPALIGRSLGPWLRSWLSEQGIERASFGSVGWAVHPGGPRILDVVRDSLGLEECSLAPSRGVLREHGNMSSPTVLFIADRLMRGGEHDRVVLLAFGPGLCAEVMLLERG